MTREEKAQVIAGLTEELAAYNVIYLADISSLNAAIIRLENEQKEKEQEIQ